MARGGARPGAGRKPKNVLGFPGGAQIGGGAAPPPEESSSLRRPPADLPDAQKAIWKRLAPLAIEQCTLVAATVPGFRELCRVVAFADAQAARVDKFGSDVAMKHYQKLTSQVAARLKDFKLIAFGKPADGSASNKPAKNNPWSEIA